MSKKYAFGYSDTYDYRGFFEAESDEQAQEILDKLSKGEIYIEDLPKFYYKDKGYWFDCDETPEEWV